MSYQDHEINRAAWNQMVALHVNHLEYRTKEVLNGGSSLKKIELEAIGNVQGKSLLHLMCQFGIDTLSWARMGANATGIDISDASVKTARELNEECLLEVDFHRYDVLELIGKLDKKFDIVFQSYGTHIWISDINKWAEVIAHYLKPGGTFFIIDEHPANVLFLNPTHSYFTKEPIRETNPTDYCETETHIDGELIEWQHKLSDILNALIRAGLVIEEIGEYDFGYYRCEKDWTCFDGEYWYPPGGAADYPIMLSIKARKP